MEPARLAAALRGGEVRALARALSWVEDRHPALDTLLEILHREPPPPATVLGITGPPGAGKSTLTNRLVGGYRQAQRRVGVLAVDPSSPLSGGALLGDRVRMMDHALDQDVIVRSMASRGRLGGLAAGVATAVDLMAAAGCDPVLVETVGVGQSEMDIVGLAHCTLLVLAPGQGDGVQAMKAGILEVADLVVVNKADLPGADALAGQLAPVVGEERVVAVSGATGAGVEELMARIAGVVDRDRRALRDRRGQHAVQETVDTVVERLRPRLAAEAARRLSRGEAPVAVARWLATRLTRVLDDEPAGDAPPSGPNHRE